MGKKKATKTVPDNETIHFRPGAELGRLIAETAAQLALSRGEVAKRMTGLALRGLDFEDYAQIAELTDYMYGAGFDEACHQVHVAILTRRIGQTDEPLTSDDRRLVVKQVLDHHRTIRGIQEEAQVQRVQIVVRRD